MAEPVTPPTPLTYQILLALTDAPRHGYGIIKEIEGQDSGPGPSTGALYLALQRMTGAGLIAPCDAPAASADVDPRRRYYRITPGGHALAAAESVRLANLLRSARHKRLLLPGET